MGLFKRIPRKVHIKKKTYSVTYPETIWDGDLCGWVDLEDKEIEVATKQTSSEFHSTILHEILHAIACEYKFRWSEKTVLRLEKAIYMTFKNNGWKIVKR